MNALDTIIFFEFIIYVIPPWDLVFSESLAMTVRAKQFDILD
jgi:hypothetical protein